MYLWSMPVTVVLEDDGFFILAARYNAVAHPPGWDEERVRDVLEYYERQTDDEAVAEDEAAFESETETFIQVPNELVPAVRELIAKHRVNT